MEPLDVFSVRDLRTRSGDLLKDAEAGQLAIITKHGRPAILLALSLFEQRRLTLAQAAKLAGISLDAFIDLLAPLGLAAVDYPAEELADELDAAR